MYIFRLGSRYTICMWISRSYIDFLITIHIHMHIYIYIIHDINEHIYIYLYTFKIVYIYIYIYTYIHSFILLPCAQRLQITKVGLTYKVALMTDESDAKLTKLLGPKLSGCPQGWEHMQMSSPGRDVRTEESITLQILANQSQSQSHWIQTCMTFSSEAQPSTG